MTLVSFLLLFFSILGVLSDHTLIFENSKSLVFNVPTEHDHLRYIAPIHSPGMANGVISLDRLEQIKLDSMRMTMGSLLLEPSPKRILFIGLGIGVLPRTFDKILPDYEQIDAVEIDPDIVEIAKEYFFFQPNDKLKVHILDGFEFVMSLDEKQTYDLIIMDAFAETFCAPDVFFNVKYVSKLKEQLTPNGILSVNTLLDCERHEEELSLYKSVFDDYFISDIVAINRIMFLFNSQLPCMKQIKKNAKTMKSLFSSLDISTKWILDYGFRS